MANKKKSLDKRVEELELIMGDAVKLLQFHHNLLQHAAQEAQAKEDAKLKAAGVKVDDKEKS